MQHYKNYLLNSKTSLVHWLTSLVGMFRFWLWNQLLTLFEIVTTYNIKYVKEWRFFSLVDFNMFTVFNLWAKRSGLVEFQVNADSLFVQVENLTMYLTIKIRSGPLKHYYYKIFIYITSERMCASMRKIQIRCHRFPNSFLAR